MRRTNYTRNNHRFPRALSPCRLRLELLEDRTLPSILTVTSAADSGAGTLRNALAAAGNGDTIIFNLPKPSTIHLTTGALSAGGGVRIVGPGPSALTVAGNGTFTIFDLGQASANTTTLSGITVTGGGNSISGGGGILTAGPVQLDNCVITQNSQGGVYQPNGSLVVTDCIISSNTGPGLIALGGSTRIVHSTITNNRNVSTNPAYEARGGGIHNLTIMTLEESVVSNNLAQGFENSDGLGGGIQNDGTLTIINSTISGNVAVGGEATGGSASGGGIQSEGTLTVIGSTFANNEALGGDNHNSASGAGVGSGGAVAAYGPTTFSNCTFFGNVAMGGDSTSSMGGNSHGGAIIAGGSLTVINCTLVHNFALSGSGAQGAANSVGGGLDSGNNNVQNTIIAGNTATQGPDVYLFLGTANNNLIGNGDFSQISNGTNGNQVGTPASPIGPRLGPLQNNGGLTQTMALLPGSSAIDAGTNAGVETAADQRGYKRIVNSIVDIGAFEFQPIHLLAVGADLGGGPEVKVYDATTGALRLDFNAYEPTFRGGVRVAVADMNADGIPDIITAPGGVKVTLVNVNGALLPAFDTSAGRAPEIKVFSGADGSKIDDFIAYMPIFRAGLFVAVADINGDGKPDIVTAPDATGQPGHTQVSVFFNGRLINTGAVLASDRQFNAYDPGFGGGVRIAAADLNRDGFAEIVTAPGIWSGPDIRVFDGRALEAGDVAAKIGEFLAYDFRYFGGVFVSTGDVNGDGLSDIVTGTNGNGGPEVKAFSGVNVLHNPTPMIVDDFFAYNPAFNGGARVAVMDVNGDGKADIITGAGPGGGPHVRIFDGGTGLQLQLNTTDSFMAFDPGFSGGVFVGGG